MDSGKIVVYGDIDPQPNILDKLSAVISIIKAAEGDTFKHPIFRIALIEEIHEALDLITHRHYNQGLQELQRRYCRGSAADKKS